MRTFRCVCGARVFFENSRCLACARELGFLPNRLTMSAIELNKDGNYRVGKGDEPYKKCGNFQHGVCNFPKNVSLTRINDFDVLLREWAELTVALNALNRSMGLPDAYPFAISPKVRDKLEFVHTCVTGQTPAVGGGK